MRNWSVEEEDSLRGCEWERDWEDVRRVCAHVGGVPCELVRPVSPPPLPRFSLRRSRKLADWTDTLLTAASRSIFLRSTGSTCLSRRSITGSAA